MSKDSVHFYLYMYFHSKSKIKKKLARANTWQPLLFLYNFQETCGIGLPANILTPLPHSPEFNDPEKETF